MPQSELTSDQIAAAMTGRITGRSGVPDRAEAYLGSPCIQNHAANLALLPDGTLACA